MSELFQYNQRLGTMTVLDVKPFTPEEKLYEQKLGQLAASALGQDWRVCWPEHLQKTRPLGWLSEHGEYGCIKAMILRAEERYTGKDAVCFIENITLPWTIILGAAWGLDPSFFISHVRPLTDGEAEQTLKHSRVPNSRGGLRPFRGQSWVTMRGYVDLGKRKNLTPSDLRDTTRRRHRESVFETRQSHTNMSFYKVSDCLYICLIDKVPDFEPLFALEKLRWFPNQTVVRLGAINSPGYLTIPRLGWTNLTAVFPIWTLFRDDTYKTKLLRCLKDWNIDEFLYQATLLQCEKEVLYLGLDIEEINDQQAEGGEITADKRLPNVQKVSTRLKNCIQENRAYEDKLRRAAFVAAAGYSARTDFEKLAVRFSELDNALVQCFYRQMTTLTAAGTQENLRQTTATNKQAQATYEQTRSMSTLTWLAFFYVPLTFVTGIFGMNVKEIDPDKPLSWKLYAAVASSFLVVSVLGAVAYRAMQKCRGSRRSDSAVHNKGRHTQSGSWQNLGKEKEGSSRGHLAIQGV